MKKEVMKRAWEIYRTLSGDRNAKLAQALKQAWAEVKASEEPKTEETTEGVITMKEIKVAEAMNRKYVLIDMVHPVKGYESYDFHVGTKCKINGYPFQIMAYNGELSFEAGAIVLTARKRPTEDVVKFVCNEKIAIICVYEGYAKAYEYTLPKKIWQQSFIIK